VVAEYLVKVRFESINLLVKLVEALLCSTFTNSFEEEVVEVVTSYLPLVEEEVVVVADYLLLDSREVLKDWEVEEED
jgi:hypothetical protein